MTDHTHLAMSAFLSSADVNDVTPRHDVTPLDDVIRHDPGNPRFLKFCFVCEEESKTGQVWIQAQLNFRGPWENISAFLYVLNIIAALLNPFGFIEFSCAQLQKNIFDIFDLQS